MKKAITLSLMVVITTFIFTSCGKFQEGPKISLKSKKARISNSWILDKWFIDGAEQTVVVGMESTMEFEKDGSYEASALGFVQTGTWEFEGDVDVKITYEHVAGTYSYETYEILRLASDELWLKDKDNNNEYRYIPK